MGLHPHEHQALEVTHGLTGRKWPFPVRPGQGQQDTARALPRLSCWPQLVPAPRCSGHPLTPSTRSRRYCRCALSKTDFCLLLSLERFPIKTRASGFSWEPERSGNTGSCLQQGSGHRGGRGCCARGRHPSPSPSRPVGCPTCKPHAPGSRAGTAGFLASRPHLLSSARPRGPARSLRSGTCGAGRGHPVSDRHGSSAPHRPPPPPASTSVLSRPLE